MKTRNVVGVVVAVATWFVVVGWVFGQSSAVGPKLQEVCVTVVKGAQDRGSGTIFTRPVDGKQVNWVLTAAHVVSDLKEVKTVIDQSGLEKKEVRYRDAQILQELRENGRTVGEIKIDAKVVNVDARYDLALLRIRRTGFVASTAEFYLAAEVPQPGTRIYHCASPAGSANAASLTSGIVAQIGRRIEEFGGSEGIYDQATAPALPGSSGGMIALEGDGRVIGVLTLGMTGTDTFHYYVPVRRIKEWCKVAKIEWLLDPKNKQPTEEEIAKIPVENTAPGLRQQTVQPKPTAPNRDRLSPNPTVRPLVPDDILPDMPARERFRRMA